MRGEPQGGSEPEGDAEPKVEPGAEATAEGELERGIRLHVEASGDTRVARLNELSGKLSYQACTDKACLAPTSTEFKIPLR